MTRSPANRTRRRAAIVALAVLVVTAAGVVYASVGPDRRDARSTAPVDHQSIAWLDTEASTTSARFEPIAGLNDIFAGGKGSISVQVNLELSGGAAEFRINDLSRLSFHPRSVVFDAGEDDEPLSFGYVSRGSRVPRCHQITVEWRQPASADEPARLNGANAVVFFNRKAPPLSACD